MRLLNSLKSSVTVTRQMPSFMQKTTVSEITIIHDTIDERSSFNKSISTLQTVPASFQTLPEETLTGTKPMLALLQAQSSKTYFEWEFDSSSEVVWQISSTGMPTEFFLVQRILLVGTSFIVEGGEFERFELSLVDGFGNIGVCSIETTGDVLNLNNGQLLLTCTDHASQKNLEKLCLLSIFEYTSVFKFLTGTIIATLGLRVSDMHVILNSAFNFKDWCEVYLEGQGWVTLWCHIDKVSRRSSDEHSRGHCQIKFYKDKKSTSSKNLVCFIPDCEYVQDIFFYKDCSKDCPDPIQQSVPELLSSLNMIKLVGNVCFPSEGFSNKSRSRSSSSMSFFHNNETQSRSSSTTTSPTATPKMGILSPSRKHRRNSSQISADSSHSHFKDLENCTKSSKGLLMRPLAHSGVSHLEAMIRFIIPMMDCTGQYGRPLHFKTERTDPDSLMFGLPKLPNVDFFAEEELNILLDRELIVDNITSDDTVAVAMNSFTNFLKERIAQTPNRDQKFNFRKLGDMMAGRHNMIGFSEKFNSSVSTNSSPII